MVGGPMKLAVNEFIMRDPKLALEITGGIVAAGSVTLRQIWREISNGAKLSKQQEMEIDLLDEQCPDNFFPGAVKTVHYSLVGTEMRKGILPYVGWFRGKWGVKNPGLTWSAAHDNPVDLIDVSTPVMQDGKLVI